MDCARITPLRILSRKWSYILLRSLREPQGFSELKRSLRYITSRVLSNELSHLRAEGVVALKLETYWLTPAGHALLDAAEPLMHWSVEHKGLRSCAPEQQCSRCATYPEMVGALVRIGR